MYEETIQSLFNRFYVVPIVALSAGNTCHYMSTD